MVAISIHQRFTLGAIHKKLLTDDVMSRDHAEQQMNPVGTCPNCKRSCRFETYQTTIYPAQVERTDRVYRCRSCRKHTKVEGVFQ